MNAEWLDDLDTALLFRAGLTHNQFPDSSVVECYDRGLGAEETAEALLEALNDKTVA